MNSIIPTLLGVSCAELITLPICTLKSIYQVEDKNMKQSINKMIKNPLCIIKSSLPAVYVQVINSFYKLTLFNHLKCYTSSKLDLILLGILISTSNILLSHPIDYIRVCIQTNQKYQLNFSNITKGILSNFYKQVVAGSLYLPLREILKNNYPTVESWKLGLLAAFIGTCIVHPFDYFKTYLMGNSLDTKINISKAYRGLHINLTRILPHFVLMTELTEYFSKIL